MPKQFRARKSRNQFAAAVMSEMKKKGVSVNKLAEVSGLSSSKVWNMIGMKKAEPTTEFIDSLVDVFGIGRDYWVGLIENSGHTVAEPAQVPIVEGGAVAPSCGVVTVNAGSEAKEETTLGKDDFSKELMKDILGNGYRSMKDFSERTNIKYYNFYNMVTGRSQLTDYAITQIAIHTRKNYGYWKTFAEKCGYKVKEDGTPKNTNVLYAFMKDGSVQKIQGAYFAIPEHLLVMQPSGDYRDFGDYSNIASTVLPCVYDKVLVRKNGSRSLLAITKIDPNGDVILENGEIITEADITGYYDADTLKKVEPEDYVGGKETK